MLKNDMVTFTAHLSVTIKRLTRYKNKVVLAAMFWPPCFCVVEKSKCHNN